LREENRVALRIAGGWGMGSVGRHGGLEQLGPARFLLALIVGFALAAAPFHDAVAKKKRSSKPSIAAAIVVDMNSGAILHSQAAAVPRHPASLTKIMTLYVLFGYMRQGKLSPNSDLVVTQHAASQAPTKLGLKPGATIKVSDAIKALVTQSANDAATVIAENLAGSEENFARLMTQTARRLGMGNTTFRNASGLPNDGQITTARDMAILAAHVIHDYPEYYSVFETRYFTFKGRKYRNHNKLLFGYDGTDGIKTGYTRASGFNLTASVRRGNKHLVAVVLGGRTGSQRDAAMRALLDKHFPAASDVKPTPEQLKASIVAEAALPAVKKPMVVQAGTAAAPKVSTLASAEGDLGGNAPLLRASLSEPAPKKPTSSMRYSGDFHVQVGAFMTQGEAENRLAAVQQRTLELLDGHLPFTASFMKDDTEWYRARFAGFSKKDAQATCTALRKLSLGCAVMPAE
jgi:D-alanyl-D-alanine carboxypeptidase